MLGGQPALTGGALSRSDTFGFGIDRGTERTPARITAGSERYLLAIFVHRSPTPLTTRAAVMQARRSRPRSVTSRATQVCLYPAGVTMVALSA